MGYHWKDILSTDTLPSWEDASPCRRNLLATWGRVDARAHILVSIGVNQDGVDGLGSAAYAVRSATIAKAALSSCHQRQVPWKTVMKLKYWFEPPSM